MMGERKYEKLNSCIFFAFLSLYFVFSWVLYYKQLHLADSGLFESDTAVHVAFAIKDHYYHSFAAFIYVFLSWFPFSQYTISLVLALVTVGSVYATKILAEYVFKENGLVGLSGASGAVAFLSNFVMAFYIKAANTRHYIGYQSANMWHNSTYTFMKFFAILSVLYFLPLLKRYNTGISGKEWAIFSILLAITTGFKPSFLTVFAPLFAIKLLVDLISGVKFKHVFSFGSTVFASLFVMIWQSFVLFGDTTDSGYAISPFAALKARGDHPKVTLILSVLFPLVVFLFSLFDFYKDKLYFSAILLGFVGFLQVFLLTETGKRAEDSNFFWGYSISLFFLFFMSIIKMIKKYYIESMGEFSLSFFIQALLLAWHAVSGIWYFALLLTGVSYFV